MKSTPAIGEMRAREGVKSPRRFLGFFLLVLTALSTPVETKLGDQEYSMALAYLIDAGLINQEMAQFLQIACMPELLQAQNTLRNLESRFTKLKSTISDKYHHNREKRHDTINAMLLEVNQILVRCAHEKNSSHRHTGEEERSDPWHKYFGLPLNQHSSPPKHSLDEMSLETPAPSPKLPSPSPTPLESPALSPTVSSPSFTLSEVSSPSPTASSLSPVPLIPPLAPTEVPASPPLVQPSLQSLNSMNSPPTNSRHSSVLGSTSVYDVNLNPQDSNTITVAISVVVTAFVTLVMAGFLFVCWLRCCGPRSKRARNNERVLPSLSDHSISSSSPRTAFEAPVNDHMLDNTNDQSFKKISHSNSGKYLMESHSPSHLETDAQVITTVNSSENEYVAVPSSPVLSLTPGGTVLPRSPPSNVSPTTQTPPMPNAGSCLPPPPPPPFAHRPPPPPPGAPRPPPPPPPLCGPRSPPPIASKNTQPLSSSPRASSSNEGEEARISKARLKPFFWDKVQENPDQSMVWERIKCGSFRFNEEMIESLFGCSSPPGGSNKDEAKKESSSQDALAQSTQLIDPRKAQNLAILLKALNVATKEVCDALEDGNELPSELIQTLLKMAPTAEEELNLKLYSGELSQLGPAERFLKVLADIPFAFQRLESLLFMCTLREETSSLKEAFGILEAACTELRKSRLFLKLLEAVLKTGNRMNDGTFRGGAQAFKLETLLKLSDVKGTDGKTTLLHFVVQEIIRSEGVRAAKRTLSSSSFNSDDQPESDSIQDSDEHLRSLGLEAVSGISNELENVKRAAAIDADSLSGTITKLSHETDKAKDLLSSNMKNVPEENGFRKMLSSFVQVAEVDIGWAREEEKRIMSMVKGTVDYFHGNSVKGDGLRLFAVVREFLMILDKVCGEVKNSPMRFRSYKKEDAPAAPPATPPAISDESVCSLSSGDEP